MNDVTTQHARLAVRASDDEREQTVALLQRSFADGRLALHELEERAGAAYAARTRAQLRDLTADLPAEKLPPRPGVVLDVRLLGILLCACPPAGVAYWLLSARQTAPLRVRLMRARPWRQLLAGAIVAGAGAALEVVSHPAGAVLVSAGVIVALCAISRRFTGRGYRAPESDEHPLGRARVKVSGSAQRPGPASAGRTSSMVRLGR
jgi:hypothetical protein